MADLGEYRPVEILLVEDNVGDVRLTIEALRDSKICNHLSVVGDGEAALQFLRREGAYADAPRPDLLLLDLDLPKRHGRDVLAAIRADPALTHLPVAIMTASRADRDLVQAYQLQADAYLTKPLDLEQFAELVRAFEGFYFAIVTPPVEAPPR